jgi:hypothetical protein
MANLELILAGVGATASLAAGLTGTFMRQRAVTNDTVRVTVQREGLTVEKVGVIASDRVDELLSMVDQPRTAATSNATR